MAYFFNTITKQMRQDDGTGLPREDELTNPDLSAVAGIPQARWVVDGETLRAPNEQESAAFDAADLQAAKVAKLDAINAKTGQLIEAGSVVINGVAISTALTNQVSLQGIDSIIEKGLATFPQPISATNGGTYLISSQTDLDRIGGLVATFVMTTKAEGRALRALVLACNTVAEVDAVEDSR
jgi:hypothetical protein